MSWNVTLNNESGIFDSRDGFTTLREAIEWSLGRGPRYNIQIDDGSYPGLHLCVTGGKLMLERGYDDWTPVSVDSLCKRYERS